jgi:hypothetical protein
MVRRRSTVRFRNGALERKHEKRHPIRLEADRVAFSIIRLSTGWVPGAVRQRGRDFRCRWSRIWPSSVHWAPASGAAVLNRSSRGTEDGDGTTWLEPVTDEQYAAANQS